MTQFPATKCADCGTVFGHPVNICRECHSEQLNSHFISGQGTAYATTTIRVPSADFESEAPYDVCVIDVGVDELVRITARLTGHKTPDPGDSVQFVKQRNGTFYFETQ